MIRLNRYFTPLYLSPQKVSALTDEFKNSGANVWNHEEIKQALLKLSNNKCAYCECNLSTESKYMEVEHYEDKSNNPDKVVTWNNLLPACKRCNGSKSTHNVVAEPIVNPFEVDPRQHLSFSLYRFVGVDKIGDDTVVVLDLNDTTRATFKRFEIGNALVESLEKVEEFLNDYKSDRTVRRRNRLLRSLEKILIEAQPQSEYSATAATILQKHSPYRRIKHELELLGLWSLDLELLDQAAEAITY